MKILKKSKAEEVEPADEQLALEIEDETPAKAPKPAKKPREGHPVPVWALGVLGVVAAALAAGVVYLLNGSGPSYSEDEVDKAVRTAMTAAQDISSWDYRTIQQDTKNVLSEVTGDFKSAYEKSAEKLLAQAPAQQAVVQGTVSKAGVESTGADGVRVLVFLNQATTKKGADPRLDQHRIRLTMVEKDGSWLVSKLEIL